MESCEQAESSTLAVADDGQRLCGCAGDIADRGSHAGHVCRFGCAQPVPCQVRRDDGAVEEIGRRCELLACQREPVERDNFRSTAEAPDMKHVATCR